MAEGIRNISLRVGEAPFLLEAVLCGGGSGIQVYVGGGTLPHIGSVVLAEPRPGLSNPEENSCTVSVLNLAGHKDEAVARAFAEAFCRQYGCPVSVSAGVHIDNASPEDIQKFLELSRELLEKALNIWSEE